MFLSFRLVAEKKVTWDLFFVKLEKFYGISVKKMKKKGNCLLKFFEKGVY